MKKTETERIPLNTRLAALPGLDDRRSRQLARLGVRTASQLLFFFPRDYEQPAAFSSIGELEADQAATVVATVIEVTHRIAGTGRSIVGILVEDESGPLRAVFFNQPYRREQLKRGTRVMLTGIPKQTGVWMEMRQPRVTRLGPDEEPAEGRILPLYPLTEGLSHADVRSAVSLVLPDVVDAVPEVLPDALRQRLGDLPRIDVALRQIHWPDDEASLEAARRRFIVQELLVLQLALALKRRQVTTLLRSPAIEMDGKIDARIRRLFPFDFTADQNRVIEEICTDMARQYPMNRLLQGDVGSGKTVVAMYAMLLCTARGFQSVLMAPTEVLARQHFETLSRALEESRVRMGLLVGGLPAGERRDILQRVSEGAIDVLVGTQALVSGKVQFDHLGLAVIDEQHRFGVAQRAALRQAGLDPHCLVMTATPIPRTIALTQFGDLDVSALRQRPSGRGAVHTYLSEDGWKARWWAFVKQQLDAGRQAFVVAPRVGASEEEDTSNVTQLYDSLLEGPLADYRIALLHGRLTTEEKQQAMRRFADGETQVLVATTVIEVGIDVPNANVMTIFGAQAFGLAQLHQLRGRVARGSHPGYVCVFTDGEGSPDEVERLKQFAESDDGFELAEADFQMRGAGELVGRRQSGSMALRIADLTRDVAALHLARGVAQEMVDEYSNLEHPQWHGLAAQVQRRYGAQMDLGDIG